MSATPIAGFPSRVCRPNEGMMLFCSTTTYLVDICTSSRGFKQGLSGAQRRMQSLRDGIWLQRHVIYQGSEQGINGSQHQVRALLHATYNTKLFTQIVCMSDAACQSADVPYGGFLIEMATEGKATLMMLMNMVCTKWLLLMPSCSTASSSCAASPGG